jgi:hypothetical protein
MKLVFACCVAVASAKSIINLEQDRYLPGFVPTNVPTVEPAQWMEEIKETIGEDCAVNPYILNLLINKLPAGDKVTQSTVWSSLRKCKDNSAVNHIMTLDYLVKNKPELYNNLLSGSNGQSAFDPNGDGVHEVSPLVVDFLDLTKVEGQSFRDNLKDWSNSKVYLNLLKWKQYNNIFNTMSLQRYQFWTRKVNDLNKHKDAAKIEYTDKLEQFRAYKPFVEPFLKKRTAPVANPTFVQPKPIIPVQPMVNVISEEEQAEAKPVQQMLFVQNRD